MRSHDRDHFYKYTSLAAALKIIETRTFRWSSPLLFNDPFDHQTALVLEDGSAEKMSVALTAAIERMIYGDIVPPEPHSLFTKLSLQLRSVRHKLPRGEIMASLREASDQGVQNMVNRLDQFNREIQTHLSHSRIFCVSEVPDNVVMWSHYGDQHRGVVFKLRCIDALDTVLLAARKVRYTDKFQQFPDADTYSRHLTGEAPLEMARTINEMAFIKHTDWAYEREWRVQLPLLDHEPYGDGTSFLREAAEVFDSIYVGCRMAEADIQKVIAAANTYLPNARAFRSRTSKRSFALKFDEIQGK